MSLEQSVREASGPLRSERVTERRRNAETLKELILPASTVLSTNQLSCSGFSWDDLFDDVHEFALKECEKLETNRTFNIGHRLCSGLLYDTIVSANKGKAYIKPEKVFEASLQILQSARLSNAFGTVYINILHKYVMTVDHYLRFMTPQTWEDLLSCCVTICCREESNVDLLTTLRLILQIIQKGATYCHFVSAVRDVIPKLKTLYAQAHKETKIQEILISIGIELLEILSSESRLTMCEYTEFVIPAVLKCYEQNADSKKKSLLFRFLELAVLVHHPRGRLQSDQGSLAHEWLVWNRHLMGIMELVSVEGNHVERMMCESKLKFHSDAARGELCSHFVELTALVSYQLIQSGSNGSLAGEYEENPAKRPRYNNIKSFNDLIFKIREYPVPWISVVTAYIRLYSETISIMDFTLLLSVMETYVSCTNNKMNWSDFGDNTCAILSKLGDGADDSVALIIQTLWNSCLRYCSVETAAHQAIHTIMQSIIELDLVDKRNLPQLIKLYNENAMPVTQASIATLNCLFRKYDSKMQSHDLKSEYLAWLQNSKMDSINEYVLEELFLHLLTKEYNGVCKVHLLKSDSDHLFYVAFENMEDNILASEFNKEIWSNRVPKITEKSELPNLQVCSATKDKVDIFLSTKLKQSVDKFEKSKIISIDLINNVRTSLTYLQNLFKYRILDIRTLQNEKLWHDCCKGMDVLFYGIGHYYNEESEVPNKATIIKSMVLLLSDGYEDFIEIRLRTAADEDFFRVLYNIINKDENTSKKTDNEVFDVDEMQDEDLKKSAIELCAMYCRNKAQFREDVLELILDPTLYNFSLETDVKTALRSIEILCESTIEKPIESLFRLMQAMCKALFRHSEVTIHILKLLYSMLEDIGSIETDTMKNNCIIMLRGYLHRCQTGHYHPRVAALVFKCVVRIEQLKCQGWNNTLMDAMVKGLESPVHSIRLYTCYILNTFYVNMNENYLPTFLTKLLEIFHVELSTESEEVLKDEAANRTSTVLHCISALAHARPIWMIKLIAAIIEIANSKAIDRILIGKVLNRAVSKITGKQTHEYLRNNLLPLLHFWFNAKIKISEISYWYFGYHSINDFFKSHMNWVIALEILYFSQGRVETSSVMHLLENEMNIKNDTIINNCFCSIMVMSLPYLVHDKYKITCPKWMQVNELQEIGSQMFKSAMQWFGGDKISTLYGEHFGSLILLATMMLFDPQDVVERFQWGGQISSPESFNYSLQTYNLVLKYFGEIVGGCIMKDLCENMPLAISNILLNLWSQIEAENVTEVKLIFLHRYIVLFERIPLGTQLDSYICNFICCSLLNTLRACSNRENGRLEKGIVCRAINIVLSRILPDKLKVIDKVIPQLISTLIMLKQENSTNELEELLSFLINDMRYCLKDSIDLVDATSALTQGGEDSCHTSLNFMHSLKTFIPKLTLYSLETLNNIKFLLTTKKTDLLAHCETLKHLKGFSEDCQGSVIHGLINALTNIAANSKDTKCALAACDCLALIGPVDLKTLIMSTPESLDKIVCVNPSQYFTLVVLQTLSANMFDEIPKVIQKTTKALKSLLSYKEGKISMEQGDLQKPNLKPFISQRKNLGAVKCSINKDNFDQILQTQELWIPDDADCHEKWLTKIMKNLVSVFVVENTYFSELLEVCILKPLLAEKLVPPLFGLIVSYASEAQVQLLSAQLVAFFQHFYERTFYSTQDHNGVVAQQKSLLLMNRHKTSVETMLQVVDFVRIQRVQYKKRERAELYNYLGLDYRTVAWAASLAGHSMAAVLYAELWCLAQHDGAPPASPAALAALPHGDQVQSIFRRSYIAIGDPDSVYGCGTGHLSNEREKLNHILRLGHFSDALLMHDVALSHRTTSAAHHSQAPALQRGVIRSFYKSGLYHIAVQYMKALPEDDDLDDVKFECYSNLGDWSLIVDKSSLQLKNEESTTKLDSVIKAYQYTCLKECLTIAMTDGNETRLQLPLKNAKLSVVNFLKKANIENCQVIYNINSNLQMIHEVEEYYELRCRKLPVVDLLRRWDVGNLMPFDDFKYIEPVLCQRSLILEHAAQSDSLLIDDVIDLQLKYAELAMVNHRQQLSSRLVAMAQRLRPGGVVCLTDARVLWANGHNDIALHLIKSIIDDSGCNDRILRANALRQYGSWMVELRYESSRDILDKYLKGSLNTLGDGGHMETQLKVYLDLAKFADAEYKQVLAYTKSSIFENKVKCMHNMRGTASSIKELQSQQPISRDEQRALHTNERMSKFEEAEITSTYAEKKSFLDLAMKYYLLTLSQGELSDLSIFRVISLWIDNPTNDFENDDDTVGQLLSAVPSRKYLPVLPQIAPRITKDKTSFSTLLNGIIRRCGADHPHHTLPILFALSNSHKDQAFLAGAAAAGHKSRKEEPRVAAAQALVQQLAGSAQHLHDIVQQMELMNNALISLAYYKSNGPNNPGTKHPLPRSEPLLRLRNLDSVLVPVVTLPVSKDCLYTDVISVVSFSNHYTSVGGVNAPKKMTCTGSDGIERTILLKGEDDLRQDAVMQQVFTIVNSFLEINQETSRRKLIIRTYKVVPLSRRSGVLEWCEGTDTLGGYLVGTPNAPGAHVRYRPKDLTPSAARALLTACGDKAKSKEHKLSVFRKILSQFKPVFHHFFTENFLAPVNWYERRLAYTKSVATSSMVGYMLGLGDRHVQNILIDKKTAEVVHIDFGIAFDQGRALPTPETVPFRLTQDVVAGFGASGVDGVFRRTCEITLQLLQVHQETLLTILQVLLCDPLYSWSITAEQAKRKQNIPASPALHGVGDSGDGGGAEGGGGQAERALLAVRSKLSGTEGSAGGGMAVPGIVARLIQNATDQSKLAQLFVGWQPYI